MIYTDYEFYTDTFGGTAIAAADFHTLAIRASREIDHLTFDRAAEIVEADLDADTIELIKLATCAVAEVVQDQNTQPGVIQSEKVGSHSVTYLSNPVALLSYEAKMSMAAKRHLVRTGLMYRGFNSGEYAGTPAEV